MRIWMDMTAPAHVLVLRPIIERIGRFGVNILGEDSQALSDCFAGAPSPLPRSAFCNAPYVLGEAGLPVLDAAVAYLACEVENVIEAGDQAVDLGKVVETGCRDEVGWPRHFRRLSVDRARPDADLRGKPDTLR
jgi:flavin reductase (DIM6/NTAB) family NADH-FMN oxidoreductase RutF